MTAPIRVLVADDHPPTRAGVAMTLERAGMKVVAEAASADAAIAGARRERPDLVVLDVRMPGRGARAAAEIARQLPSVTVVMLTVSDDDDDLFEALQAGASGYLLKDMDPERLPVALSAVMAGEAAIPRTLMARVLDEFRSRSHRRRMVLPGVGRVELTDREREVLDLLRQDMATAEIAGRLGISEVTVRRHISHVVRKLGAPSREAALRLFSDAGSAPDQRSQTAPPGSWQSA